MYRPTNSRELEKWFHARLEEPNSEIHLLEQAGEPLGFLVVRMVERGHSPFTVPHNSLVIDQIAVVPKRRRSGLGKHLMTVAHERAAELNASQVELMVRHFNEDAAAFYQSLGYEVSAMTMIKRVGGPGHRQSHGT